MKTRMTADPSPGDGRVAPEAELRHGALVPRRTGDRARVDLAGVLARAAMIGPIVALVDERPARSLVVPGGS